MKKGLLLSFLAIVFVGAVVFGIWYINESGKMRSGSKDSFIPNNSALIIQFNSNARLSGVLQTAFADDIRDFRKSLLARVADTLIRQGYVDSLSRIMAMRVEGKQNVALLYVMDNRIVLSRNEMADFLKQAFQGGEKARKYDSHKIYTIKQGKEEVYFSVCGGIVLFSDSDLYIEDGLKQFDQEEDETPTKPRYQNLSKYFSAGAGVNILLNTEAFSDLLPLVVRSGKINPVLDVTKCFKWGAFDGEFSEHGICLNGFMSYAGLSQSYMQTLEKQQPKDVRIDGVIPAGAVSFGMLNLSNIPAYFSALEAYRYNVGLKEKVFGRKQQLSRMFGQGVEEELQKLLLGEFAVVTTAYRGAEAERDGVVIAQLKSGSLCQSLLERMMKAYARFDGGKAIGDYVRTFQIDREKSFDYYAFPAEDMTAVYWGYLFNGIPNRYVFIEDNYLIFASSESAVKGFIRDYVHSSFVRDAEWYQNARTRLSGKYNLAWFAEVGAALPWVKAISQGNWLQYVKAHEDRLSVFSTLASQWSNEGDMLYNTIFLSTDKVENDVRPHLLWQTKLDARVSMKPVPVTNHVTGERELFVQDDAYSIYLINDAGRILWKQPIDGRINSEVYQVDYFKNGKLQYLFSTPSRMYLIDRNGNPVGRYPVTFRAKCPRGMTVFDYDGKREYRIFVPGEDRELYLYGLDGALVQGWDCRKADKEIVTRVQHFRVDNKDYIVFADRYRLYILDRKGKERVKVGSVFDLKENTDLYLAGKGDKARLVFANATGGVHTVDFDGREKKLDCGEISAGYKMNVADLNGDGMEDIVFTDSDRLFVYDLSGKLLHDKHLDAHSLDYPYVYRFSAIDSRIGLIDREQSRMLLLSPDGTMSKGFPITGDSPFSIIFSGNDGFFLFAGADNGTVIKYKVQR